MRIIETYFSFFTNWNVENVFILKFFYSAILIGNDRNESKNMDYKKKSLKKFSCKKSYEEIDTRLASGWYVDSFGNGKKKQYKTKEISFTISKKQDN